jgi:hypothetical protein
MLDDKDQPGIQSWNKNPGATEKELPKKKPARPLLEAAPVRLPREFER